MDEDNKMNPTDPALGPNIAQAQSKGNKMVWLILAVVVVLLVIGGVYYYVNSNKPVAPTGEIPAQTTQVEENLEDNLNAIEVEDVDKDFSDVDKDLKNL